MREITKKNEAIRVMDTFIILIVVIWNFLIPFPSCTINHILLCSTSIPYTAFTTNTYAKTYQTVNFKYVQFRQLHHNKTICKATENNHQIWKGETVYGLMICTWT